MDENKLSEALISLILRVTAIERVLMEEGVITKERYTQELSSCTNEMQNNFLQSSNKKNLS